MLEVYVLANQIPNLLRRLFAEGAFSQAFVPVVAEYRAKRSTEDVRELVDSVAGTLGGILAIVSILGVIVAPVIVCICAPGFASKQAGQFELAVEALRWTFPYLLFVSLTALAGGVLNSYSRFALPAFTSVVLNVVMIVFAAWISPHFEQPVIALAIGVFVGGILQVVMQVPALLRLRLLRWPRWNLQHEAVRRIGALMGPAIIGSSMGQLSVHAEHGDRLAARRRQHDVAVLRRSPGRVSARRFQHRARDRDPAEPVGASRAGDAGGVRRDARLGAAAGLPDRDSGVGRDARARGAADRRDLPPRQVHGLRRRHDAARADGVLARAARLEPDQGARDRATTRARTRRDRCASPCVRSA